jgi:hypothetical protein
MKILIELLWKRLIGIRRRMRGYKAILLADNCKRERRAQIASRHTAAAAYGLFLEDLILFHEALKV